MKGENTVSNVIQFLETLGNNPAMTRLSAADYAAAVAALDIDDAQRQALLNRDNAVLNDLLGGREKMLCVVWPADEPVRKEDDQPGEEQPAEDTPPEQE